MEIFDSKETEWPEKVNFVDVNNVMVGYDMAQDCCEHADWFISEQIVLNNITEHGRKEFDVGCYCFDTSFFKNPKIPVSEEGWDELDDGGMVIFKLVASGKPDLYLHLFNSHNGYYGHGFEAKIAGQKWQEDYL